MYSNISMYSNTLIDHFMCPRNVGSMPEANAKATVGDPNCGDSVTVFIKVVNNIIEDISYLVFGCPASIATSSMTSELAKGKSVEEALMISEEDVEKALEGLPDDKKHCSNLGVSCLKKAISNYINQKK